MRVVVLPCSLTLPSAWPAADEAHLFVANPEQLPLPLSELEALLTPDERDRAARYRAGTVREQFLAGRGLLRRLLGGYLGTSPHAVPITYILNGKPVLAGSTLHFNVTHTHGLGIIAIAARRVGVDVEQVRTIPDVDGLVGRFFSPLEQAAYRCLPRGRRLEAFFRGWVCKEAVIKAAGASVQYLDGFDVELDPAKRPGVLAVRHSSLAGDGWAVADWSPADGFAAAIALEGTGPVDLA
ncbi:MAG TPA: 4'-phosphopantetheinyl transferase superfamily protein [Urbifossiella sp.]|nr:4'-phosphopantetheinyl transferase superfamily protein [Urbifossiella sp.]